MEGAESEPEVTVIPERDEQSRDREEGDDQWPNL